MTASGRRVVTAAPNVAWMVRSDEFVAALNGPLRARTLHFALHHLAPVAPASTEPAAADLSTAAVETSVQPVEDFHASGSGVGCTLGAVVPKRHARRAVTRSLLKRQIRAAVARHGRRLTAGLWIVRLRAPFERTAFPSAASLALQRAARSELDALFDTAPARAALPTSQAAR